MSHTQNDQGILRVIQSIASNRESGELEIISSRNHGTLRFSKGKLVDATLGPLSGFQAINAALSLSDVQLSFKPLTSALSPGSIGPNERRVLKSFFGIEAADATEDVVELPIDWNPEPHQVVPLSEVDEVDQSDLQDTPTVEVKPIIAPEVAESLAETAFVRNETPAESRIKSETQLDAAEPIPEMLTASKADHKNINASVYSLPHSHVARRERAEFLRRMPVAVFVMLLVILAAAAAITLITKLKPHRELASAPGTVAEQPSVTPESRTPEGKQESIPNTQHEVQQRTNKSQTTSVAQQQNPQAKSGAPSQPVAARQRDESTQHDVQDLTGEWHLINTVAKTAYRSFQNMQIGFRLKIEQKGKDFTARGEKVSENGRALPARSRTPIHVTGSIDGDNVVATFIEDGRVRRTNGRFAWRLQNENAGLEGTFVTGAANSSGKSAATKEQ